MIAYVLSELIIRPNEIVETGVASDVIFVLVLGEACQSGFPTPFLDGGVISPQSRGCGKDETIWLIMAFTDHKATWKATGVLFRYTLGITALGVPGSYQLVYVGQNGRP